MRTIFDTWQSQCIGCGGTLGYMGVPRSPAMSAAEEERDMAYSRSEDDTGEPDPGLGLDKLIAALAAML